MTVSLLQDKAAALKFLKRIMAGRGASSLTGFAPLPRR
jgi:hypothetical protein